MALLHSSDKNPRLSLREAGFLNDADLLLKTTNESFCVTSSLSPDACWDHRHENAAADVRFGPIGSGSGHFSSVQTTFYRNVPQ